VRAAIASVVFAASAICGAQAWQTLLAPERGIDWSHSGVGAIPARAENCATLKPDANVVQINGALAACPAGQTVFLSAGLYTINGTLHVPSNVTLRGAGADETILNATGTGPAVIAMGGGVVPYRPRVIQSGAFGGSARIELAQADGILPGMYLAIAEKNDPSYVTAAGSGGNCNWCDGGWTSDGSMARGQIVTVTAVSGNMLTIAPALYSQYMRDPVAVPFEMATSHAGIEDLQVRANNTGYATNFLLERCAFCWVRGVESNYADGDHVTLQWGYRDEVRDSYFSNAFLHVAGAHDSDIEIGFKTSASLIENNIIERTHDAVMPQWGAAGNVIAYNYTMGEFDSQATNVVIGGVDYHGAHPQFNLLEGNVLTAIYADSVWGSSSDTTAFRNWVVGTNRVCAPMVGRGTVDCTGTNGHYGFQASRAVQVSYLSTRNNFVGNVLGSAQMESLRDFKVPVRHAGSLEYPDKRPYETAVGFSFGYGSANDDGTGSGCAGGTPPCHTPDGSASDLLHGNFNAAVGGNTWAPSLTHTLPRSFYLTAKPAWWGGLPYPATGPDVTGGLAPGGHSYGNPAESCYVRVIGGSDGGAGSPLRFNAARCYAARTAQPMRTIQGVTQ
jgi:hypothetical protein